MIHVGVIESQVRDTLVTHGDTEVFHRTVLTVKAWAGEGGVRMTDDELRGALTALGLLWSRAAVWGLGAGFLSMLGEAGAILTRVNRDRELTADEEADILRALEAMVDDSGEEAGNE